MIINNYSIISKQYALSDNSGTALLAFKYIPLLINNYASGKKTLDYGCGSGSSIAYLKSLDLDVEGVDISIEMLQEAKNADNSIQYHLINSGELPHEENAFDIVFSSFVLFEVSTKDELTKILNEIYRVLKKHGIFIFITGSSELYSHNWLSLDVNFNQNKTLKSGDIAKVLLKEVNLVVYDYFWTDEDYHEVIQNTCFKKIITVFPLGEDGDGCNWLDEKNFPPYAVYCLKKE